MYQFCRLAILSVAILAFPPSGKCVETNTDREPRHAAQSAKLSNDDWTCLRTLIYTIVPGDYLYYCDEYHGGCDTDPQPDYYETVYYAVPQSCPDGQCIPGTIDRRENRGLHNWDGLGNPVDPSYKPTFSPNAKIIGSRFEYVEFLDENNASKSYKMKVFDLLIPKRKTPIHVAYEISGFPVNVQPSPISIGHDGCKSCSQGHGYVLKYRGKSVLLLTAT